MDVFQREANSTVYDSLVCFRISTGPHYQAIPHIPPPTIATRKSLVEDMISGQNNGQETVGKTLDTLDVTTRAVLAAFYT